MTGLRCFIWRGEMSGFTRSVHPGAYEDSYHVELLLLRVQADGGRSNPLRLVDRCCSVLAFAIAGLCTRPLVLDFGGWISKLHSRICRSKARDRACEETCEVPEYIPLPCDGDGLVKIQTARQRAIPTVVAVCMSECNVKKLRSREAQYNQVGSELKC